MTQKIKPIHFRNVKIGEDQIKGVKFQCFGSFIAVACGIAGMTKR